MKLTPTQDKALSILALSAQERHEFHDPQSNAGWIDGPCADCGITERTLDALAEKGVPLEYRDTYQGWEVRLACMVSP